MGRQTVIPWSEIRAAHACGLTLEKCAEKFNVKKGTVLSRASREGWSRALLEAKTAARENAAKNVSTEVVSKDAHVVLAEDLAERAEKHKINLADMIERKMEALKCEGLPEIKYMSDVKVLDDIARRNFGLDKDAAQGQKCIVNLAILLGD